MNQIRYDVRIAYSFIVKVGNTCEKADNRQTVLGRERYFLIVYSDFNIGNLNFYATHLGIVCLRSNDLLVVIDQLS